MKLSAQTLYSRSWLAALFAGAFAAATLPILTRKVINHPPVYDELLHVLAARGVAQTGEPVIGTGTYDRVELFTRIVAAFHHWVADELMAARLPSLLGTALLIAFVGVWTTRKTGLLAGLASGLLLSCNLLTIDLAVFARFYTLHALAFFAAFVCLYEACSLGVRLRSAVLCVIASLVALAFAFYFQITTVIAAGAMGAGLLVGVIIERQELAAAIWRQHATKIVVAVVVALAVGLYALFRLELLQVFRDVPLWGVAASDRLNYYNTALVNKTPFLWPLVPLAALATCARYPRLGWTIVVLILLAIGVHSLAASKAPRYIYYCLPFICILLGVGLAIALSWLSDAVAARWPRASRFAAFVGLGVVAISFAASAEGYRAARLLLGKDDYTVETLSYATDSSWASAQPILRELAGKADTIVVSNAMKGIYYLGRYDYELSATIVGETDTQMEFGVDLRTGSRAISTPESLDKVIRQSPHTLIVFENRKIDTPSGVSKEAAAKAAAECQQVDVPPAAALTVWYCPR